MEWRRDIPTNLIVRRLRNIWSRTEINDIFHVNSMPDYIISCLTQKKIYQRRVKLVSFFWYNGITFDDFINLMNIANTTPGRMHRIKPDQIVRMRDLWNNLNDGRYLDRYFTWSIINDQWEFLNGTIRVREHQGRRRDIRNGVRRVMPNDNDEVRC